MKVRIMGHVICYAYYMGYTTHQERSKNETDAGSITASGRQNGPGKQQSVAAALDALNWEEILGCIAGDDTVMCAARTPEQAEAAQQKLRNILKIKN